ncbi:MAG: hypothetical protein M1119_04840 [Firmicutes bacterium]|nr:hypothetical protein [Bacillota bacterium]
MEFLNDFWQWSAVLSKEKPMQFGLLTVATMAGIGAVLAGCAELVFKALKIDLGKYKKEYEGGGMH